MTQGASSRSATSARCNRQRGESVSALQAEQSVWMKPMADSTRIRMALGAAAPVTDAI